MQVNVGDEPTLVNIHLMPISLPSTTTPSTTTSTTTTPLVSSTSSATTPAEEQNSSPTLNLPTLQSNSSTTNTTNKKVKVVLDGDWGPKMQGFHRGLSIMLAELSSRSSSSCRKPTPPPRFVSIPLFLLLYVSSYFIQHQIY